MNKLIIKREKNPTSAYDVIKVKLANSNLANNNEEYTFEDVATIDFDENIDIDSIKIRRENEEVKKYNQKLSKDNEKLIDENKDLKKRCTALARTKRKNEELQKQVEMQDAYITFLRDNIKELKHKLLCYN